MNAELKKLIITNRIAKLENQGGNTPIINKLKRKLRQLNG